MRDIPLSRLPFPFCSGFGKLLGWVLLSGLTIACSRQNPFATADRTPAVPVKVQALSSAIVEESSDFVGTLVATQKATLQAPMQGRIQQLSVQPGDRVSKGAIILSLQPDTTALATTQAQINLAKANRETALQQLQEDQTKRIKAQSNYQMEQANFERVQYVAAQGGYNQNDLNQRKLQLEIVRNDLQGLEDQIKRSQTQIAQADAEIRRLEVNAVAAKADGQSKQVMAPIAGVIGELPVKVGDVVVLGGPIGSITQNDRLDLQILVPADRSSRLREGIPVIVIDPTTKRKLAKGQLTLAVSQTNGKSFVFVAETSAEQGKRAKQVVRQQPVELGNLQGSSYQVISGLKPGDRIATTNIEELKDGVPIKPES
jgi:multidrug efflux pump subunit AcrA (membrane-fusion protein)